MEQAKEDAAPVVERTLKLGQVWRAGYTPADRQTSWGVLHHTAQYLYSACI